MLGGITTSFFEIVMPACVAKWNPRSLNASSTSAVAYGPWTSTSRSMTSLMSRFLSGLLTNS